MKLVIQRVTHASVTVSGIVSGQIGCGLLILVGVSPDDTDEDIDWLASKTSALRIFNDENGVMNRSVVDIGGGILAVSQFTLMASTKKGNRPSYIKAAPPETAKPVYERFCKRLETITGKKTETGIFGADMKVDLLNDGPVTIVIDSKNKE